MDVVESLSKLSIGIGLVILSSVFVFTPGLTPLGWTIFLPLLLGSLGLSICSANHLAVTHTESLLQLEE